MVESLDASYWNQRYLENKAGWDIGYPSRPLKTYIDQLEDKSLSILIPGGGNAYEAEYLYEQGFQKITVVDLAQTAKDRFLARAPHFPEKQFLVQDFFEVEGQFDLILEQTFFCALQPSLRMSYAQKMHNLLKPAGKVVGVLFDFPLESGPPFGGSVSEYLGYFQPYFDLTVLERCYNSIAPRANRELFINFTKKV